MKKKYLYLLLRVLVYLLVLGAILYGLYESPYNPHPHSAEDIRRWVVGFGVWAPLIYVAVYTIRPLLFIPDAAFEFKRRRAVRSVVGNIIPASGWLWLCKLLLSFGTFRRRQLAAAQLRRQLG